MIDHAGIGFAQIDAGRIGGLTDAKRVADYASAKGVTYVNHTFTSQLALSASIQPFAGLERDEIAEYPIESRAVARAITRESIEPGTDGLIRLPDAPGLGMTVEPERLKPYLADVEDQDRWTRVVSHAARLASARGLTQIADATIFNQ